MSGGRQSGKDLDEQAVKDRLADTQKQAEGKK